MAAAAATTAATTTATTGDDNFSHTARNSVGSTHSLIRLQALCDQMALPLRAVFVGMCNNLVVTKTTTAPTTTKVVFSVDTKKRKASPTTQTVSVHQPVTAQLGQSPATGATIQGRE